MDNYTDIIDKNRPFPTRTPMTSGHRAKQFAPFAALKGYEEAICNTEQLFVKKPVLAEDQKESIDQLLHVLKAQDFAKVRYFKECPGSADPVGKCIIETGLIEQIDVANSTMSINQTLIDFDNILEIVL